MFPNSENKLREVTGKERFCFQTYSWWRDYVITVCECVCACECMCECM